MKIRFSMTEHLFRRTLLYLAGAGALCLGFVFSVNAKTNPSATETYSVFAGAVAGGKDGIRSFVNDVIGEDLKEIHLYAYSPNGAGYDTAYSVYGINDADILILPLSEVEKLDDYGVYRFYPLTEDLRSDDDFVYKDDHYGMLVYDGANGFFEESLSYVDGMKYYAFVSQKSVHVKGFSEQGKTDCTYRLLRTIADEKEESKN